MGRFVFKLPDVGEGTAEAEIVAWYVSEGDMVQEDQVVVDVMTDKATVELTSPVTGRVVERRGGLGGGKNPAADPKWGFTKGTAAAGGRPPGAPATAAPAPVAPTPAPAPAP